MRSHIEIEGLLIRGGGVVARRDHPELVNSLKWLATSGRLVPVLPGVFADPERALELPVRLAALRARHPDAVVVGTVAAHLTFWPERATDVVDVALAGRPAPTRGYRFHRRQVPLPLLIDHRRLRLSCPALTAMDLAEADDGESIDRALRARAVTLPGLHSALLLCPGRPGNRNRRRLLLDSRNEPWSQAERRAHRLLRRGRITGWRSNYRITCGGRVYYIDIAFPGLKLAIEIDGRLHETDADLFESDRSRQNALALRGWTVLRFTWRMLQDDPDGMLHDIRAALRQIDRGLNSQNCR